MANVEVLLYVVTGVLGFNVFGAGVLVWKLGRWMQRIESNLEHAALGDKKTTDDINKAFDGLRAAQEERDKIDKRLSFVEFVTNITRKRSSSEDGNATK